ncbi:hypothetical protein E7T09_21565 [Deinococcus sp. KSM4-11]|uniref:hypothetical protein n=1 Tax=Deinococcus sp. KSM4-11 TaxID=2568654 RepID=UPI0010A51E06|nr:hypothetical protein [Deinococcus sp. KSM4-11]THF83614.1 hypothetical protein E7T09_21565 [Deinococcus sp. KSM4-11]
MMNATPYKKAGPSITGGRVLRRMPDARLRPVPAPSPAPARSLWQRLWAALWPMPTLEQLYARQQRHAEPQHHRPVMTLGGHLALPSSATRSTPRVQADLS